MAHLDSDPDSDSAPDPDSDPDPVPGPDPGRRDEDDIEQDVAYLFCGTNRGELAVVRLGAYV